MSVSKDLIRERLQRAKELKQTASDAEQAFRTSIVNMSNSFVLLAHQVEEIASILKDLNNRVLKLESGSEQVRFKPPYVEK